MIKEEAIKILKDFHDKSALFSVRTALETLCPELKEPDDREIKKALLNYMTKMWENSLDDVCGVHVGDVIAWLEKQGETYTKKNIADLNEFVKEYSFNIPSDIYNLLPKEKQSTWINEIENAIKAGAQWAEKQEVKEVDLEKEIHNAADQYDINNNGNIYWEDLVGFAKHFFELGLKAQKGE